MRLLESHHLHVVHKHVSNKTGNAVSCFSRRHMSKCCCPRGDGHQTLLLWYAEAAIAYGEWAGSEGRGGEGWSVRRHSRKRALVPCQPQCQVVKTTAEKIDQTRFQEVCFWNNQVLDNAIEWRFSEMIKVFAPCITMMLVARTYSRETISKGLRKGYAILGTDLIWTAGQYDFKAIFFNH